MNELYTNFNIYIAVWNTILTALVLYSIYIVTRFQRLNNHVIAMAKNYASIMGQKSAEVRGAAATERIREESKAQLVDAISTEIPWGANIIGNLRKQGMNDSQLFALITDPEVLKGLSVLADAGKGLMKGIFDLIPGPKDGAPGDFEAQYKRSLQQANR